MSFDIFLQIFRDGDASTMPRLIAEKAFGPYIAQNDEDTCWVLEFADGYSSEVYLDADDPIDGFMVANPAPDERFWTALYDIMRQAPTALMWSGCAAIVDETVIKELPPDFIDSVGQPHFAGSASELVKIVEES